MDLQQEIFNLCIGGGLPAQLSKFIVCQSIHETDNFTSGVLKDNNNLFGYSHVPGGRWQITPTNHHDGFVLYAAYKSVDDSIHEIIDYYKRRISEGKFPDAVNITALEFANDLKAAGYFSDTAANYFAGINRAYSSILEANIKNTLDGVTISFKKKVACVCPSCGTSFLQEC